MQGLWHVGEKASPQHDARELDDVIGALGSIVACFPTERSAGRDRLIAAETGLDRMRDDLVQRRIGDERARKNARPRGAGAIEFERRRRAVRL